MIIGDKKRVAGIILSKMNSAGRMDENEVAAESGSHDEYTALAEDFLNSFHKRSVQGLADCLRTFHKLIMEEDEVQDERM